ncbi:DUF4345 domain-containing protein [Isoptericola croceus]|uniref:DUF4345 domain-containing protein n=1 Tax=Isoptericola croceus TaxID=3031406 RepID=UPI0023F72E36|nr:DUF4345 domain-containing protein [Isoptericola croceus]
MGRRTLVVVVAVLGGVAVLSGILGITGGPDALPGGEPVNATVDSQYRFANVFWLTAGLLVWWSLRRPEQRSEVTRAILAIAAVGGVARLLSVAVTGWPHPVFVAVMVLELTVVPLVIWWHVLTFGRAPMDRSAATR